MSAAELLPTEELWKSIMKRRLSEMVQNVGVDYVAHN